MEAGKIKLKKSGKVKVESQTLSFFTVGFFPVSCGLASKTGGGKMYGWRYVLAVAVFTLFATLLYATCFAYTDAEIADAIYLAEGGPKAKVPYGILSVKVKDEAEARQVCLNTIRNNRKRFADYGHKQYATYLEFLASRYAPIGAGNDPKNLNQNWLKNVKYFLERGQK